MGRAVLVSALSGLLVGLSLGTATAQPQTVLVSVSTQGEQGNGDSQVPSLSADGTRVAFASAATNLVANDTNEWPDAFVHDLQEGWTRRVSVTSGGGQTGGVSISPPVISGNGRWVAFVSDDPVIGEDDNEVGDVFLHDLQTGETQLVSQAPGDGLVAGGGIGPSLSFDARFVAFNSYSRLVPKDHNYEADIYVWDRVRDRMRIVSLTTYGTPANDHNDGAGISLDGGCVAFRSYATNLDPKYTNHGTGVFVHDLVHGGTKAVSTPNEGPNEGANSGGAGVSAAGKRVLFGSNDALVANHDGYTPDVYSHNLLTDRTEVVTDTADSGRAGGYGNSVSADGRYAAVQLVDFESEDDFEWDIVVRDIQTESNRSVLIANDGGRPNDYFDNPTISAWATAVGFDSAATNMVRSDSNGKIDVFVRRLDLESTRPPVERPMGCGEGIDARRRPPCLARKAHWIGTRKPDDVMGTEWSESHHAGRSNDGIQAGSGDDRLCGNGGDDYLDGGPDDDELAGGGGADFLYGGDGHDVCIGGPGKDEAQECEVTRSVP